MRLDDYLKERKETEVRFAARAGLTQATINRLRHGKRCPNWVTLRRIREATEGAVTAADFEAQQEEAQ